jgi:hypothetical protein
VFITRKTVTVTNTTTTKTGAYGYTEIANGTIKAIKYTKAASGSFSTGAGLVITGKDSSLPIFAMPKLGAATFYKFPLIVCQNSTNGTLAAYKEVPIAQERISIRVGTTGAASTNGAGVSQSGVFDIWVEGN